METSRRKNFLLLLALSKDQASYAQGLLARIKRDVDASASPAWIDSRGAGIFISSALSSRDLWKLSIPDHLPSTERDAFRDMLVLEIGKDSLGYPESKAMAWLNSHRPAA